ncbi:uncharacterized protein isoform X3 [Leptinotarsa decemlineata]|uniref:uncharacterized protein isoform X3 n=1 Tax=Leptinotarsa decemlineata TaxID=7539 RepID=UPI003D30468C
MRTRKKYSLVASKRRFWNPRKWFKRKNKVTEDAAPVDVTEIGKDALRSRSTSELSVGEEEGRRRSSSSMHPGLSVSHDSVFHSPNSGSDMELDVAQSSSSLSISQPHVDLRLQTELTERLRLRRGRGDTSEDDEGLPHSPCNSPTVSDGLLLDKTAIKDLQTKSHSTCSDGSLLSMDSYEDEDSLDPHSRCSSKVSLREKSSTPDTYLEFGPSSNVAPLNHSAAHHRVSVKPKRKHGAPKRPRGQQLNSALPVTPEVNEDSSIRSTSPETTKKESLTDLPSMNTPSMLTEIQLKCSSLPPGLSGPGSESKLNRSKSNAGSKSQDPFSPLHEEKEKEGKLSLFDRIFPRKSGRKKKSKEEKEAKNEVKVEESKTRHRELDIEGSTISMKSHTESSSTYVTSTSVKSEAPKPTPLPRSGAASRQRVLPIDIPASPDGVRKELTVVITKPPSEKPPTDTSPFQAELENRFKHRQISISTSPPKSVPKPAETPPQSPRRSPRSPILPERNILPTVISTSTMEQTHFSKSSSITTRYSETRPKNEEFLNKIKMPGLSSLQQRVLSLNQDDIDNGFKSMTEITNEHKITKPVTKSHSFKTVKPQSFDLEIGAHDIKSSTADFLAGEKREESRGTVTKAASLDSVKHLDDQIHFSNVRLEFKNSKPDVTTMKETKNDKVRSDVFKEFLDSPITISGPSHTAIVNVTSNTEDFTSRNQSTETVESGVVDGSHTISIKEHQVSVTKIQVKRESTQLTQSTVTIPTASVPECFKKPLNRVEIRPSSNIIISMKSPSSAEEQNRPKTLFDFDVETELVSKPPAPRKFSKENVEIIEKNDDSSPNSPTVTSPYRFKKPEAKPSGRKSSMVSILPESQLKENTFKSSSASLESLKTESDKSSQDSLDKLDEKLKEKNSPTTEPVVLRRKSLASKKKDDEPELMKVFARRSLKLKDSDLDSIQDQLTDGKTNNSDKENQTDSPVDERKKLFSRTFDNPLEPEFMQRRKSISKREEHTEIKSPVKAPLVENKVDESVKINSKTVSNTSPVFLKKSTNNIFLGQRAFSMNPPKSVTSEIVVKKQASFSERKITEQWMSNIKNEDSELKDKVGQDSIISNISPKGDFITEPKNFSQRKAEWEKRAQLAQKKTP